MLKKSGTGTPPLKGATFVIPANLSSFFLAGIGLVEKKSKNTVHWCGARGQETKSLSTEFDSDLAQLEAKVKLCILLSLPYEKIESSV